MSPRAIDPLTRPRKRPSLQPRVSARFESSAGPGNCFFGFDAPPPTLKRYDSLMSSTHLRSRLFATVSLLASLLLAAGCGGGVSPTGGDADFKTRRSMSTLASFYGDYLSAHGAPPKDEAAFRAFLQERSKQIERMKIGGVDGLLKSPRDGQPLVVVYGKRIAPPDSPNTPWAAYEQMGVDGKRMGAQVRGEIRELTADEIAKIQATPARK